MMQVGAMLRAKWGSPAAFDRATALALLEIDASGREKDFYAHLYTSREMADEFASANREHFDHDWHGPIQVEGGWVGVVDIRKMVDRLNEKAKANGL